MNSLYHHFTVGFNFWYVFAPLFAVVIIPISLTNVRVKKSGRPYLVWKQTLYDIIIGIFAVIIGAMMFTESWSGVVQLFDNGLSQYESGVWSLFMATFGILILATMYGFLLHEISLKAQKVYFDKLTRNFKKRQLAKKHATRVIFGDKSSDFAVENLDASSEFSVENLDISSDLVIEDLDESNKFAIDDFAASTRS